MASSTSPALTRALIRVEETMPPSTSTRGTMRVSKSPEPWSISGSPLALAPNRKFSPTDTLVAPSFSTSTSEMNSSAVFLEKSLSNGITTSSSTPRPSITSRLTAGGMISFGAASGWMMLTGCGSKVRTVSAPSITA